MGKWRTVRMLLVGSVCDESHQLQKVVNLWNVPLCSDLGSESDLHYVKDVIDKEHSVVGTMEQMQETLELLEKRVPQFFAGIKRIYNAKGTNNPGKNRG